MRLVLGDDHRMFLDALAAGLTRRGHEVVGASDRLVDLVDLVETERPDACVFDLDFGGRTALEAVTTIRRRHPTVAIVLLSGTATDEVWRAFEDHRVDGVVNKLCDLAVLNRAIERACAGERVVERFSRPARQHRSPWDEMRLSRRERAVVALLTRGASTDEMAAELGVSTHTVRSHVQSVMRKLGVNSRAKVASLGIALGAGAAGARDPS